MPKTRNYYATGVSGNKTYGVLKSIGKQGSELMVNKKSFKIGGKIFKTGQLVSFKEIGTVVGKVASFQTDSDFDLIVWIPKKYRHNLYSLTHGANHYESNSYYFVSPNNVRKLPIAK